MSWDLGAFGTFTESTPLVEFQITGVYSGTLDVWSCSDDGYDSLAFTGTVERAPPVTHSYVYLPLIFRRPGP